jgi:predicted MFS family arabinose efflux permease
MLGIAFSSNSTVIILCLCGGLALISGYIPGYMTSIVNVAPAHTAAVSAYCQFACQMAGIIAPLIIGMVTSATSVEVIFFD